MLSPSGIGHIVPVMLLLHSGLLYTTWLLFKNANKGWLKAGLWEAIVVAIEILGCCPEPVVSLD